MTMKAEQLAALLQLAADVIGDMRAQLDREAGPRPIERDLEAAAASLLSPIFNQCDGCRRGMPVADGIHRGASIWDVIGCTADRYVAR
jgi:hypothetical protein